MPIGTRRVSLLLSTILGLIPVIAAADPLAYLVHASADVKVTREGREIATTFGMELLAGDLIEPDGGDPVELTLVRGEKVLQVSTSGGASYTVTDGEAPALSGGVWDQVQVALGSLTAPSSPETEVGAVAHDQILVRPELEDTGERSEKLRGPLPMEPGDSTGDTAGMGSTLGAGLGTSAGGGVFSGSEKTSKRSTPPNEPGAAGGKGPEGPGTPSGAGAPTPAPAPPTLLLARWTDARPVTEITAAAGAGPFERRLSPGCQWEEGTPVESLDEASDMVLDVTGEPCFMVSGGSALWTLSLGAPPASASEPLAALWESRDTLTLEQCLAAGLTAERHGMIFLAIGFYETALEPDGPGEKATAASLKTSMAARLADLRLVVGDSASR